MRNPYYEALAGVRQAVMRACAGGELDPKTVAAIGRVAVQAVKTHNAALLLTAFALARRLAEARGFDPAAAFGKLSRLGVSPPKEKVFCSACGRAWRPPEPPHAWRMHEVTWDLDVGSHVEVIAVCGAACEAEIVEARHPGYVSFANHEALRDFCRRRGCDVPIALTPPRDEKRPS